MRLSSLSSPSSSLHKKETAAVVAVGAVVALAGLVTSAYALSNLKQQRYLKSLGLDPDHDRTAPTSISPNGTHVVGACVGLAVDMGSSSVRCSAYVLKRDGVVPVPGTLVQIQRDAIQADGTADAEKVLRDVEAVIDGCLHKVRAKGLGQYVAVVGFAAFVMNLVGVDQAGHPITPVLTYADRHPSTGAYVEKLRDQIAAKAREEKEQQKGKLSSLSTPASVASRYLNYYAGGSAPTTGTSKATTSSSNSSSTTGSSSNIYDTTGAPIHTAYAAPQLWRMAEQEGELISRVFKWQTLVSLALARWTGATHVPVSYSEASWTGLLDFRALEWCAELVALLPIHPLSLPDLADYHEGPSGKDLTAAYAKRWPELVHAHFFLGLGDGACANLGSGCRDNAHLAVTIGTSAAARIVVEGQLQEVPRGLWCYRIDRARLLLGGALTDGGSLVKWMTQTFQVTGGSGDKLSKKNTSTTSSNAAAAEALACKLKADSHGLSVLPFLSGERAPGWNPDAKATITGLTKSTTAADVYRAGLESVALRLGAIVQLMAPHLSSDAVVGASGTALESSPLWRQILADVLGMYVVMGGVSEATSAGAAVLMAEGVYGKRIATTSSTSTATTTAASLQHKPEAEAHAVYQEASKRQNALYEALYFRQQNMIREE